MYKKILSAHDSYFQNMMERIEVAKSLFQAYLSEEILQAVDWATFKIADSVRRSSARKASYTDITYEALIKGSKAHIYFTAEQERSIDKTIVERIMQYNVRLMYKHKKQGHDKLPLIVNMVIYNGIKEDYPYSEDICSYYEDPAIARLLVGKNFSLVNVNKPKDEDFLKHGCGGMLELLLKRASQANFTEWMEANKDLMRKFPAKVYLEDSIDYALEVTKAKPEEIINSFILVYPKLKEEIMTAARQLKLEGIQEGIQQGIQEGIQQGMQQGMQARNIEVAKNMLQKGLDIKIIEEVTSLNRQTIEELRK